jgi:hypothetical protein
MPGSEFRLLPRLPLEYKTYKLINPTKLGRAMTDGWVPVAAINYTELSDDQTVIAATRFLIGKELRSGMKAGPTPILMFPQPDGDDEEIENTSQVQQLLDRIALMSQEEVLALHTELRQNKPTSDLDDEDDEDEDGTDEVNVRASGSRRFRG